MFTRFSQTVLAVFFTLGITHSLADDLPPDSHFRMEVLATGLADAMEMELLPNGEVLIVQRVGGIRIWSPETGELRDYDHIDVIIGEWGKYARESGLLGVTLDPNFAENRWLYVFYSPVEPDEHRISRFVMGEDGLKDEKIMLRFHADRKDRVCHEGGALEFGPDGLLYISVGDNTCPFESDGSAPIDETPGRETFDAQRSAANSNDLRGSILRIRPLADGTYDIPSGNLFAPGTPKTRPEIFVMGCRNPWRISIDPETSDVYWGEVGPDAAETNERGPVGYDEINQAQKAGYYGWPYVIAEDIPYRDYDFVKKSLGSLFEPQALVNDSPNNTGLRELPEPVPAFRHMPRSSWCAGPVIRPAAEGADLHADALPPSFDDKLITYDWNNGRVELTTLGDDGAPLGHVQWLADKRIIHPSDMILAPDRRLYILEYGSRWHSNTDGRLLRVSYTEDGAGNEETIRDPRMTGLPEDHPGTELLSKSICLSCHQSQNPSVGPSYTDVALKYGAQDDARSYLISKIKSGSANVWGQIPMPPQTLHTDEELGQIVDAILTLSAGHQE